MYCIGIFTIFFKTKFYLKSSVLSTGEYEKGCLICMPELVFDEQPFIMIGVIGLGARAGKMIKESAIHYNGPLS